MDDIRGAEVLRPRSRRTAGATTALPAAPSLEEGVRSPRGAVQGGDEHTVLDDSLSAPADSTAARARTGRSQAAVVRVAWTRALPLAAVLTVGMCLVAVAWVRFGAQADGAEDPATSPRAVEARDTEKARLEAVDAWVGLSEDNKDHLLSLCWRLSGNPIHECQTAYLESLGEYPGRVVAISALDVDRFEVSNQAYDACVAAGHCAERGLDACRFRTVYRSEPGVRPPDAMFADDHPAVCVTYSEAEAYCAWRGGRLPTREEWERIARAGDDRLQPWGTFWVPGIINWGERDMGGFPVPGRLDGSALTAPVDAHPDGETPDGVRNIFGNAAEWVATDARDQDGMAAVRGGSYADDLFALRVTRDTIRVAERADSTVGFRCVADVD